MTIAAIVTASCMVGCNNDKEPVTPTPSPIELNITAESSDQLTRMTIEGDKIGGFATHWEVSDKIGAYTVPVTGDPNRRTLNAPLTADIITPDGSTTFRGSLNASSYRGENTLYAYYPYGTTADNTTYQDVACTIPTEQEMTPIGSHDTRAAYMVAEPCAIDLSVSSNVGVEMRFRHLGSFVLLSLKANTIDSIDPEAEIVQSVCFGCEGEALSGDFELNLADGSMQFREPSSSVRVTMPEGTTLGELAAWIITAPFTLSPAECLTIEITTDKHRITKQISGKQIDFTAGGVTTLNLTIDSSCTIAPLTPPEIALESTTIEFAHTADSRALGFTLPEGYSEELVSAHCDADWLTIDIEGSALTISTSANESGVRSATLTLLYNGNECGSIAITQLAATTTEQSSTYTDETGTIGSNKSRTLVLSGYEGRTITKIAVNIKPTQSDIRGSLTATVGGKTVWQISKSEFGTGWYPGWSSGAVDVVHTLQTEVTVGTDEDIIIQIRAYDASLTIKSYTIYYRD